MTSKKWTMLFVLPLALLAACGDVEELKTSPSEPIEVEASSEATPTETEDVQESELGLNTIYMKDKAVDISETMGPVTFKIDKVQTSRLSVNETYRDSFDGAEEVTVVAMNLVVTNTVDETIHFYPNQGTIVTNTGEQVDADLFFSDDVGGDFLGKVKKEGNVLFFVKAKPEELTEIKFVTSGPSNEAYENVADAQYEYTIDVTK